MTKLACIKLIFVFLLIQSAYAQKTKYKDIYALLTSKQYDAAEPFLRKYLAETSDNPNAYLYMGIVLQEKSQKDDILKQTSRTISRIDSAVIYYDKAYKAITDKEIKKNSEFYQAYNRRDLRTGEFGVKLSDIQFDLEKRMEGLRERIDRVKMTKHYFTLSDTLYKKTNRLYRSLQERYPGAKELYLRADESTLKDLGTMITRFDSCLKAFDQYKSSINLVGKTRYNQTLSLEKIEDLKTDGLAVVSFYDADLKVWDYKTFAVESKYAIEKEIWPLKERVVAYDANFNKLTEKVMTQGVSVKDDISSLNDNSLMEQLKKHDKEPLPEQLIALKIANLEYRFAVIADKQLTDSSNVAAKLKVLGNEVKYLNRLDSISTRLLSDDLGKRSLDYDHFVKNSFGSATALKSFITSFKDYSARELSNKGRQLATKTESLKWIVSGQDSIPLFTNAKTSLYRPLIVMDEKYTAGLYYADSVSPSAYLYSINASRSPEVKVKFPVEKESFNPAKFASAKALGYSDNAGQLYLLLLYSEAPDANQAISVSLAKIYKSDGLAWSANHKLAFLPREMLFSPESGEITIKGEGSQQSILDKNGKLVR
ncbi:MAG: hypothetical protein WKF87_22175 [Chryseolinea sp.]